MKKIYLAVAAVLAFGTASAFAGSPEIYQTAYSHNRAGAPVAARITAVNGTANSSEIKSLGFGADAGNSVDLTDVKGLKSQQLASADNDSAVSAQTNLTSVNLNGGGTVSGSAQGALGPLGAKVTVSADTKSIASATAVGAHVANDYTAVSAKD